MTKHLTPTTKAIVLILLVALIVLLQYEYDATKITVASSTQSGITPFMIRATDMGFHPAAASFFWITTMPEILDLFRNRTEYFGDLAFVNAIDPKMSYPYAFSVLTMPVVPTSTFPDAVTDADKIGVQGLVNADPDWRIPYYLAMNYYLYANDKKTALYYFDVAAQTPGIPQFAERFALNFGIGTSERVTTEALWTTIRDTTNDELTKERAQAYIDRLTDLDYLDSASAQYKKQFGVYPTSTDELVAKGIIPSVPQDPFGFKFIINKDGTSGVDLTDLPSYIETEPAQ